MVTSKNSPHLDARSLDVSLTVARRGTILQALPPAPRAANCTRPRWSMFAPLAIIGDRLVAPLHHQYPLSAEMALVKYAWLLSVQTLQGKLPGLSRAAGGCIRRQVCYSASIPYPGSVRVLALYPEASGLHIHRGCQFGTTLGLKSSTMCRWSLSSVKCQ